MEEYFVGTEGGELSFLESSDGNILVDQGQNIQHSQAANIFTPTQLYFVQAPESVASQSCIVGGETQTLYSAPVQQENVKFEIPNLPIKQVATLQSGQDVMSGQSQVISIQQGGTNKVIHIPRNVVAQERNVTLDSMQVLPNIKQKIQILPSQLCVTSSAQNGQITDNKKIPISQQRFIKQIPHSSLQQIIGQAGKYVCTNKNLQGITQINVQSQISNIQRDPSVVKPVAIHVQQTTGSRVQQNSPLIPVQQSPSGITTLQTPFRISEEQQSTPNYQIQSFPIRSQVRQGSSGIQLQQTPSSIQLQQQPSTSQAERQVSAFKLEYSSPKLQINRQSNINVPNNQIVAQVQPVTAKRVNQPTSCISIRNNEGRFAQSYVVGTQSSLSNTSGGYVVQSNKTPNLGQTITVSNANILLQCNSCKTVVEKSGICPTCGGVMFTKVISSKSLVHKVERNTTVTSPTTSLLSQINIHNQEHQEKTATEVKKVTAVRGKGKGRGKGRGRGRGRIPEEPVILTLSSDDENEEKRESKSKASLELALNAPLVLNPKEPIIKNEVTHPLDGLLIRKVTQPLNVDSGATYAALQCRNIRIGSYRTVPSKKVIFSSSSINIVVSPIVRGNPPVSVQIPTDMVFKILVHFGATLPVFFLYVKPQLAACIRYILGLNDPTKEYFDPCSKDESQKRITIVSEKMNEEAKKLMKHFYKTPYRYTNAGVQVPMLEEISQIEAHDIFQLSSIEKSKSATMKNASLETKSLLVFPPKHKGAVTITIDDYNCLEEEQFLNDVIIDFYLKWLMTTKVPDNLRSKTHVFSTFFYKRLTAKPGKGRRLESHERDPTLTPAQRRHSRVKSWTKGVDIFQKEFIIIPINEHSHWFLAIICFPGLNGIIEQTEIQPTDRNQRNNKRKKVDANIETPLADGDWSDRDEASGEDEELLDDEEEPEVEKPQPQNNAKSFVKQPCILIFDSLRGAVRVRILATLREYLTVEYKQKRGIPKIFSKDTMKGCIPMVPQQTNLSDCGIYTLQFAESFFEKPLQDYKLPIKYLTTWFPQEYVDKKRESIARLIKSLMDEFRPNHGINLPTLFQQASDPKITISNPLQNLSDSLVNSSSLKVTSSPVRKMQPDIIRDSETSEILLIVNRVIESPVPSAGDNRTVEISAPENDQALNHITVDTSTDSVLSNVASVVKTNMPVANIKQFSTANLPISGVQRQINVIPHSNVVLPSTQSLLNLAEIAASRERNVSCNVVSSLQCNSIVVGSQLSVRPTPTVSTCSPNNASLSNYISRNVPLPSMTNVLNRVVSSGCSVTVSSSGVKGLLSSSKVGEKSFILNRSPSPLTKLQQSQLDTIPVAYTSNLTDGNSTISSSVTNVPSKSISFRMVNNVSNSPTMAATGQIPVNQIGEINDINNKNNQIMYKLSKNNSLQNTKDIFPPQKKLSGNYVIPFEYQQPAVSSEENMISQTAVTMTPPSSSMVTTLSSGQPDSLLSFPSFTNSVPKELITETGTSQLPTYIESKVLSSTKPLAKSPRLTSDNSQVLESSHQNTTTAVEENHSRNVSSSFIQSAPTPPNYRLNTRNTSSGRAIAPPKRYLDYEEVPTKRRNKGSKLNCK